MEAVEWTWINAALWALAAVVKFVVTPSAMIAAGHSFMTAWAISSFGAAVGVGFFWNFGKWWFRWLESRWQASGQAEKKKIFNPRRRRIVWLKNVLGLPGLLLISGLISVPITAVIGAKYFRESPGAMYWLIGAFVIWAATLTAVSWGIKHGWA